MLGKQPKLKLKKPLKCNESKKLDDESLKLAKSSRRTTSEFIANQRLLWLTGRPTQLSASENVQMQVVDRLPSVGSAVGDQSIAILLNAQLSGNFGGRHQQMARELMILFLQARHVDDLFLGNQQHMDWSLR